MPCTIASIMHDHFALFGNRDPNTIELDHFGDLLERFVMELMYQKLELIDPLVHCSQSNRMTNRGTPAIADVTQALTTPTTPEGILRQIHPKSLILLENAIITNHIMLAMLAFQHRDV